MTTQHSSDNREDQDFKTDITYKREPSFKTSEQKFGKGKRKTWYRLKSLANDNSITNFPKNKRSNVTAYKYLACRRISDITDGWFGDYQLFNEQTNKSISSDEKRSQLNEQLLFTNVGFCKLFIF